MKAKSFVLTGILAFGIIASVSAYAIIAGINKKNIVDAVDNSQFSVVPGVSSGSETIENQTESIVEVKNEGIVRSSLSYDDYDVLELHNNTLPVYSMEEVNKIIDEGTELYYNIDGSPLIYTQKYVTAAKNSAFDSLEAKSYIYHMMLNSVDYFNTAEGSMTYAMNIDYPVYINFQTDIDKQVAYESESQNGKKIMEVFVADGMEYVVDSDNLTYDSSSKGIPIEFCISDNDRVISLDDGETLAVNRNDITNLGISGNSCLFPQSYAMSHLVDFSSWEISGRENILGRECVLINGTYEGNQFKMYVDLNTGILLKYENFNANDELMGYVQADSVFIDENINVNEFNTLNYKTK
ncbi:MAG: hypothetical protein NC485_03280 [Ruminococcus flavefaciens]|nr:hypothetical protein [Ruminococcus flavefaciens]MCM1059204.1 hypothetical protein [Eubacterium sp.]